MKDLKTITVADLFTDWWDENMDDMDISDGWDDEFSPIAYCGGLRLTDFAKQKFEAALALHLEQVDDITLCVSEDDLDQIQTDDNDLSPKPIALLNNLLFCAAGYCTEETYDKLFIIKY